MSSALVGLSFMAEVEMHVSLYIWTAPDFLPSRPLYDFHNFTIPREIMTPLGIAILGSGIFAVEQHKPGVEACDLLKLVAAYSRSTASVTKAFGDSNVDLYSDDSDAGKTLDDLLARKDVDAVIIAYASSPPISLW